MNRDARNRWSLALAAVAALVFLGALAVAADEESSDIDWNRAQQLYNKAQAGENLTPEEREYLQRAREARARGEGPQGRAPQAAAGAGRQGPIDFQRAQQLMQKSRSGETLTPDEQAYLDRARAAKKQGGKGAPAQKQNVPPPRDHLGLLPIDQMTARDSYKGEDGGLYGGGQNVPPPAHLAAALKEAAKVVPLGPDGKPSANGSHPADCCLTEVSHDIRESGVRPIYGRYFAPADEQFFVEVIRDEP